MQCTKCKYPATLVVDTDYNADKSIVKRRRECVKCGIRFTTHEKIRDQSYKNPLEYKTVI